MRIVGMQKLTLLDFPGHMAATLFCPGCNFRCPFCHNASLVLPDSLASGAEASGGAGLSGLDIEDVRKFLRKRRGILEGVCITGGEPLLQPDIADFCAELKGMGFAVKLDTNGSFPAALKGLVGRGLVDYVAMDMKAALHTPASESSDACVRRFSRAAGVDVSRAPSIMDAVGESAAFLLQDTVPYEFRTTVVRELHDATHLRAIAETICGAQAWYLQGFVDSGEVIGGSGTLHACSAEEMHRLADVLRGIVASVRVRGLD